MARRFLIPLLLFGTIGGYASGFASMARYRSGAWEDGDRCGRWSRSRDSYGPESYRGSSQSTVTPARPAQVTPSAPAAAPAPVAPAPPQQQMPQIVIVQPAPQAGGWQQPMMMPQYQPIYVPVPQGSWPTAAVPTAPTQAAPAPQAP
jgi:hypothetical protein